MSDLTLAEIEEQNIQTIAETFITTATTTEKDLPEFITLQNAKQYGGVTLEVAQYEYDKAVKALNISL